MPLKPGKPEDIMSQNIKQERLFGRPEPQAVAIAMSEAGKSKKKLKDHKMGA